MAKRVAIMLSGGGQPKDVTIDPGTTVGDVLRATNLAGYRLSKPGGEFLGESEVLFPLVVDGDKLNASTAVEVGASAPTSLSSGTFFDRLLRGLRRLFGGRRPVERQAPLREGVEDGPGVRSAQAPQAAPKVVQRSAVAVAAAPAVHREAPAPVVLPKAPAPVAANPVRVTARVRTTVRQTVQGGGTRARKKPARRPTIAIGPDQRPYWEQQRWQHVGREYRGYYRTRCGAWDGYVTERGPGVFDLFVYLPPQEVLVGPHGACFRDVGRGWYAIHFGLWTSDVNSAIMAVERTITEAFRCAATAASA